MTLRWLAVMVAVFVAFAAASAQTSVSVAYEYAPISFPAAPVTHVSGINNSNVIAGYFYDSQYNVHGFTYSAGKYTAVNFPGAVETQVLGINDYGDIVGTYQMAGTLNFHGFVRHKGEFASVNDPAAKTGTMASGINKYGMIVGSYDNAHGFIYQNGTYKTLDAPQLAGEPHQTQLNGLDNSGWIAGQVYTGGIWRGFWFANGHFHFVEAAGSTDSEANGINDKGDVAGCHDSQTGFVSFAAGNYAAGGFPAEQKVVSCASSVNNARAVVGSYSTVSNQKGFLGVPALTLEVSQLQESSTTPGVVQISASASGKNPVAQIQVWANGTEIYHVSGGSMNTRLRFSQSGQKKLVLEAIDSKGLVTKVSETITVN